MIEPGSVDRFDGTSRSSWDSKRTKNYRYSPSGSEDGDKQTESPKYKKSKNYKKNRSGDYSSGGEEYNKNAASGDENRENDRSSGYSDVEVVEYKSGSSRSKRRNKKKSRRRRSRSSSRRRRSNSSSSSSSTSSRWSNSSSSRHHSRRRSSKSRSHSHEYRRDSSSPRRKQEASPYPQPTEQQHPVSQPPNQSGWYPPPPPPPSCCVIYPPQTYPNQNFGTNYHQYPGYEQSTYYQGQQNFQHPAQPPPTHDYSMGGPAIQGSNWDNNVVYPDISQPPPSVIPTSAAPAEVLPVPPHGDKKADEAKKEAVEQELIQQKRTLAKQREEYVRRKISLNRELSRLKDQKRDLVKENSKDNERILRENAKLQGEIQTKLKSIDNVIEMLSNIIGDSAALPDVIKEISKKEVKKSDKKKRSETPQPAAPPPPPPPPTLSNTKKPEWYKEKERSASPAVSEKSSKFDKDHKGHLNLVHYDPELHWCADCEVFPRTVIDYLNHLHSDTHKLTQSKVKLEDQPWHLHHTREPTPPFVKDAPCKRIPIRGVQFLVPSSAWYCSLCKEWMGDLLLATKHLKSKVHAKNYNEFTTLNPHWEVDWLTGRTRAYEKNSEAKTRQREKELGEAIKTELGVPNPVNPTQPVMTLASFSDQLLAMLTQSSKLITNNANTPIEKNQEPKSSADSSAESQEEKAAVKEKKKKKKSKKRKRSDKSPKKRSNSPKYGLEPAKTKEVDIYEDLMVGSDMVDDPELKLRQPERVNKPNSSLEYLYNNDFQVPEEAKKEFSSFKTKNNTKEVPASFNIRRNYVKGRHYEDDEDSGDFSKYENGSANIEKPEEPVRRGFQDTKIVLNSGDIEFKEIKRGPPPPTPPTARRQFAYPADKSPLEKRYKAADIDEDDSKYSRSPDTKYHKKSDKKRDRDRDYKDGKRGDRERDRYESSSKSFRSRGDDYGSFKEYSKRDKYEKSIKDPREKMSKERRRSREKDSKSRVESRKTPDRDRKGKRFYVPGKDEEDNNETIFEKKTSESAAKKKDVKKTSFTIPKTKLPFIGRMPILKKKTEPKPEEVIEESTEPTTESNNTVEDMKIDDPNSSELYNRGEEFGDDTQMYETEYIDPADCEQPLPKSTLIISKRPRLMEPEIIRKEVIFKQKVGDDLLEQDMEIEEQEAKDELHKDFKDALELLFPENKDKEGDDPKSKTETKEEVSAPPVTYDVMAAQSMGYDMSMYTDPQTGYQMAYYDQAAYLQHQAYLQSLGYDTSQMPQGYMIDPSAYLQQAQAQTTGTEAPAAETTAATEEVTAPTVEGEKAEQEKVADPPKKKNPLSQRMRRHLKKKAAMESEKPKSPEDSSEVGDEPEKTEEKRPFAPVEMSELALLGIEENDVMAQSFKS